MALAEEQPSVSVLEPYLVDSDAQVRATAIATLIETTPAGFGLALVQAMQDEESEVRAAASRGLLELAEVLTADAELDRRLRAALTSSDPEVRAAVVDLLRCCGSVIRWSSARRWPTGTPGCGYPRCVGRCPSIKPELIAAAAHDPVSEVRIAVVGGLGAIRDPSSVPVLAELSTDPDALVRAAAVEAAGELGCPAPPDTRAARALADPARQVRKGAALALTTAARGWPAKRWLPPAATHTSTSARPR
jgi:HEAT repeat protein